MLKTGADTDGPVTAGTLRTLRYFGLFRYPLLPAEIQRFHPCRCSAEEVQASLDGLTGEGRATVSPDGFYAPGDCEDWSAARKTGHKKALDILSRAGKFTRVIKSFPFVEAVAISGSLSKYHAGEDADIDYFIITRTNRLWIARTLLHLFKKLTFIPGYQHCFCMNYFLDESALELTDKNLYTAIELVTLLPVYNADKIGDLRLKNSWVYDFLPNAMQDPDLKYLQATRKGWFKKLAEWKLNLLWPESTNLFLMRLTDQKWRKKWHRKSFPMEEYDQAFFTSPHVSKNHPANFQKRILEAMEPGIEKTVL